ncbi:MAG: NAD(P)/FAD-dependent oxidoreductase [Lachnospiraceae bacterium]|nr:NAD(P)/FAD-dependent oxidoreductase [Lachnospiraceae bacterium]
MKKKIIVIGAGAAGLMAAISAARSGAEVTILEAQDRPGRKLLVTGNGRCNLTNTDKNICERYHGTGAALAEQLLKQFSVMDTLAFFWELGLLTKEKNEYVYPYSSQASSVLEVLLAELRRLRVKLKFSVTITEIIDYGKCPGHSQKQPGVSAEAGDESAFAFGSSELSGQLMRYAVVTPTWTYTADAVILACGSKAAPSAGASGKGYALAQALGHSIIHPRPALVPFTCQAPFPEQKLAGVRCRAEVSLLRRDCNRIELVARDTGELQWTRYGVSGIVIFQLSRFVQFPGDHKNLSSQRNGVTNTQTNGKTDSASGGCKQNSYLLRIDFLPDYTEVEIEELLLKRAEDLGRESVSVLLRGLLNEKLIPVILKRSGEACGGDLPESCSEIADHKDFIYTLVAVMKGYLLPVTGTKSFDQAQVCAGGVDCREISDRLESRLHEYLYFAGELLDVDGPCGGYNLQWAWTSGYLAGKNATEI